MWSPHTSLALHLLPSKANTASSAYTASRVCGPHTLLARYIYYPAKQTQDHPWPTRPLGLCGPHTLLVRYIYYPAKQTQDLNNLSRVHSQMSTDANLHSVTSRTNPRGRSTAEKTTTPDFAKAQRGLKRQRLSYTARESQRRRPTDLKLPTPEETLGWNGGCGVDINMVYLEYTRTKLEEHYKCYKKMKADEAVDDEVIYLHKKDGFHKKRGYSIFVYLSMAMTVVNVLAKQIDKYEWQQCQCTKCAYYRSPEWRQTRPDDITPAMLPPMRFYRRGSKGVSPSEEIYRKQRGQKL
ncbi:uncharacterized protein PITG_18109 [Phytophthora infestans T30-4]|uniref:Uncharacterized protein n=1 Tax=Phytophthora infestans (strain T30-4) TaxID=403677 RepID=D0NY79_PHYIT|nr:uncharacterized protein PITG_18109 [Phytophthora infestans T30-4]EEY68037.1 conserved hypothetical protein [Phytophthora infestans T30-4]|eukprot:XP_002997736.1 conserved hypothetical protein [Phytophthora infestans T30-4]